MGISRCPNGHYYDDAQYAECPFCGVQLSVPTSTVMGRPRMPEGTQDERTLAMNTDEDEITLSGLGLDEESVTVGLYGLKYKGEPTVGWLVCTGGPERGRDYRLHAARNQVGRSAQMDVAIFEDARVSRDRHFSVVYDPKGNVFYAVPGTGAVTVNGKLLTEGQEIREDDVIGLGDTSLVLIPYCKGARKWGE